MSRKDQTHKHAWQKRLRDWLVLPHTSARRIGDISPEELSKHTDAHDCWIAIDGVVYDTTRFLQHHPGGPRTILNCAGRDATAEFAKHHASVTCPEVLASYILGQLRDPSQPAPNPSLVIQPDGSYPESRWSPFVATGAVRPKPPKQLSEEERESYTAVFDDILGGAESGAVPKDRVAEFLHGVDEALTEEGVRAILAKFDGTTITKEQFFLLV
jgi:cytochrome b involved in lipid metabolism